ncbi:TIGR04222 domain-containing membrane protein [Streptomyces sp. NPDC093071]|uniref:TIGR04222 domain-containing membrane protein n=1 Tax=Streptomyces sp. NPDC093071 TaxID=3366022 RepID=UPI00380D38C0
MDVLVPLYYLAGAVAVAVIVTRLVRTRGGSGGPVHDRYEAAFLNGGPARVVDSALAALQSDGRIAVGGPGIVAVVRPTARDLVERAVLQEHAAAPHGALHHLRLAVMRHPAVQEIGDGLAERGLLVDPATRRTTTHWCTAVAATAFLLFPVSVLLSIVDFGTSEEFSAPFVFKVVPALFVVGITAVVCASVAAGRITPAGRRAVAAYGRERGHLADAGHLVAVHGLRALPDPVLREQLLAAARINGPRRSARGGRGGYGGRAGSGSGSGHHRSSSGADALGVVTVWCADSGSCGGGGGGGGSSCSSGSCSSGSCSGGGSGGSCGGGGGSSCSGSSSSSCSSSSSSSCSSSSSSS